MDRDHERAIEWDCSRLAIRFYSLLDERRYDELAGLFADDGVWVRLGHELVGRAAIGAAMTERKGWLTAHIVSNVLVDVVDADHANSSQYVTLYRIEGHDAESGPAPVVPPLGILRHRDRLIRVDGGWKIARKTSCAIMTDRKRITHYDN